MMDQVTRNRWVELWQKLDAHSVSSDIFEKLITAYASPERFYHNLAHIVDCLALFDRTKSLAIHLEEVELAIWFHDAVYDPRRSDNEQKSVEWAESVINQSGVGKAVAERVSNFILATCHDMEVTDTDAQLMVDIDLSILGRATEAFWQYEKNIRKEYAWVPEELFREKRVEILRGFLNRPSIYYHETYREMFENKARVNLQQAIARLIEK